MGFALGAPLYYMFGIGPATLPMKTAAWQFFVLDPDMAIVTMVAAAVLL